MLSSCRHNGWGNHNCAQYEDAGVRCRVRGGENKFITSTELANMQRAIKNGIYPYEVLVV